MHWKIATKCSFVFFSRWNISKRTEQIEIFHLKYFMLTSLVATLNVGQWHFLCLLQWSNLYMYNKIAESDYQTPVVFYDWTKAHFGIVLFEFETSVVHNARSDFFCLIEPPLVGWFPVLTVRTWVRSVSPLWLWLCTVRSPYTLHDLKSAQWLLPFAKCEISSLQCLLSVIVQEYDGSLAGGTGIKALLSHCCDFYTWIIINIKYIFNNISLQSIMQLVMRHMSV